MCARFLMYVSAWIKYVFLPSALCQIFSRDCSVQWGVRSHFLGQPCIPRRGVDSPIFPCIHSRSPLYLLHFLSLLLYVSMGQASDLPSASSSFLLFEILALYLLCPWVSLALPPWRNPFVWSFEEFSPLVTSESLYFKKFIISIVGNTCFYCLSCYICLQLYGVHLAHHTLRWEFKGTKKQACVITWKHFNFLHTVECAVSDQKSLSSLHLSFKSLFALWNSEFLQFSYRSVWNLHGVFPLRDEASFSPWFGLYIYRFLLRPLTWFLNRVSSF